jgi:spermidine synthase
MERQLAATPSADANGHSQWVEEVLTLRNSSRLRFKVDRILFDGETEQQSLIIFENAEFGRVLMLDGATQLATKDEFTYHEMMAHVPLFAHGHAKKAMIVGGGDGGVLREALKHHELEQVTLCEIDSRIIDLCRQYLPEVSAGAHDDPRAKIVIADGAKFLAGTEERFDVIMVDSTDPVGPGAVLFTHKFYAACQRALNKGGVLVTQNGLPFMQGAELKQSVGYFRDLFDDAFAYLVTTPSYLGGPLSFGWATDNVKLRQHSKKKIEKRYGKAPFKTRYWRPDVHVAAFALPSYVLELVSDC